MQLQISCSDLLIMVGRLLLFLEVTSNTATSPRLFISSVNGLLCCGTVAITGQNESSTSTTALRNFSDAISIFPISSTTTICFRSSALLSAGSATLSKALVLTPYWPTLTGLSDLMWARVAVFPSRDVMRKPLRTRPSRISPVTNPPALFSNSRTTNSITVVLPTQVSPSAGYS